MRSSPSRVRGPRGFGLFDALVSLALLAFGMLAVTRFEGRLSSIATESSYRNAAALLAEELTSTMLADTNTMATSPNCYTLPAVSPCTNAAARAATDAWRLRVLARLPDPGEPTSAITANGRMTVTVSWRLSNSASFENEPRRSHQVQSDIRQ